MSDPCFRRINRNIVECKDGYKFFNINAVNVLIETLWNVKRYRALISRGKLQY